MRIEQRAAGQRLDTRERAVEWLRPLQAGVVRLRRGRTGEALSNAREAILLPIEDTRERGEAIPEPAAELVRRVALGA